jgi:hypothetical protein
MADAKKQEEKSSPFMDEAPEGWNTAGTPDIDGWWSPEYKDGTTTKRSPAVVGKVVGIIAVKDKKRGGTRSVSLIELVKPTIAIVEKKPKQLEAGAVVGVGVRHKLQELALCVENHVAVFIKPEDKKEIGGGQTMWTFDFRYKGKLSEKPTTPLNAPATDDAEDKGDDDIPF